jgi:hypothetical protein
MPAIYYLGCDATAGDAVQLAAHPVVKDFSE